MPLFVVLVWQLVVLYASTHFPSSSATPVQNTDQIKCSDGWLSYHNGRGRCYFLSNTTKSWPDALSDCQQRGANLLSIHNAEENTYVSTSVTSQRTWIGLNDRNQEGLYKWTDGSPYEFSSWGKDLPDDMPPSEDCVEINFQQSGEWNDLNCSSLLQYICIKEADPCTSYSTLLEGPRDTHLEANKSSTFLCDDQLRPGWYRFSGGEVAISSIHKYHCGTKSTIWMNDKFPSVKDGIAEKKFCFNHLDLTPNGCLWSEQVHVRNCRGDFMVYHLPLETILCPMAICTGRGHRNVITHGLVDFKWVDNTKQFSMMHLPCTEYEVSESGFPPCTKILCPPGKTSATGFEPCKDMYPIITGQTLLTGPEVIDGSYQHICTFESADNSTDARFLVKWLLNNVVVKTVTADRGNRTSFFSVEMWTGHVNEHLECRVQSYYENTSSVLSKVFYSNRYFGGVKVEPSSLTLREGVDQTITVISTLPVSCDNATRDSCEVVLETVAPGLYIGGECDLVLRPSNWDEGTHESRLHLSLGTQVDPAVKPEKTLSISFETMLNNVPGLEYWSGITVPQTKVLNTDTPFSTCRGSGDPHFTASFNPGIYHELGVSYYNMYHLGDFNFASDTRAQLAVQARMYLSSAGYSNICAVAVQKGDDVIFINSCQRSVPSITANNLITDGSVQLCGSNEYQITTNQGHRISVIGSTVTATCPHGVIPLEAFDVNNETKQELCNPSTTVNGMTTFTSGGIIASSTVGYFRVQPDQNLFEGHRVKMVSPPVNNGIYCSCNSKQKGEQNACGRGQKVTDPYIQASDDYTFISSAVHDFQSECEISITSNIDNYNTTTSGALKLPDILSKTCPNLCSMHGTCVDGVCHCETDREWKDCSVKTGEPFNITGIERGALCDRSRDTNCFNPRLVAYNLGEISTCMVEQSGYLKGRPQEGHVKQSVKFVREHASIVASNLTPIRNLEFEAIFLKIYLTESTTSMNQTASINYTIYDGTCQMCENFICYERLDACTINGRCYKDGHVDRINGTKKYVCDPVTSLDQWTVV